MSNPLDTDAGSELFSNYEAELKLVQADLNQKLDQIEELSGEERKSAIRGAERALDEAKELVCIASPWVLRLIRTAMSSKVASSSCDSLHAPMLTTSYS